jgi:hypothetical protein
LSPFSPEWEKGLGDEGMTKVTCSHEEPYLFFQYRCIHPTLISEWDEC